MFRRTRRKGDAMDTMFETKAGTLRGSTVDGTRNFLGIPYGAPTAAAGRFMAPRAVEPWQGVREARAYGASSWQMAPADESQAEMRAQMLAMWGGANEPSMSEDCLVLNVW